jgi:hypothetical protein
MFIESTITLPNSQEICVRVRTGEYGESTITLWVNYRSGSLQRTNPFSEPLCDSNGQPVSEDDYQIILYLLQQKMASALFDSEIRLREKQVDADKTFSSFSDSTPNNPVDFPAAT